MGLMLLPSPPSLAIDMSTAVLTTAYLQFGTDRDYVFCVESEFYMQDDRTSSCAGSSCCCPTRRRCRRFSRGARRLTRTHASSTLTSRARPRRPAVVRPAHRSVGRRRAQQPRRPLLQQGAVRGGGRRVHARARARPEDAGRAAQPRDRVLQHRLLRPARRRAARAAARAPGRPRRALGARPRVRAARPAGRGGRRVQRRCCATTRTTSARSCSSASPRRRAAISSRRSGWFERALALDPTELRRALLHRRGAVQSRPERRGARGAASARSS